MRPADKAWLTIVAGVVAWDLLADEMLSQASRRYRVARPVLWPVTIIYIAGHLIHVWPERYDPLSQLARVFGR